MRTCMIAVATARVTVKTYVFLKLPLLPHRRSRRRRRRCCSININVIRDFPCYLSISSNNNLWCIDSGARHTVDRATAAKLVYHFSGMCLIRTRQVMVMTCTSRAVVPVCLCASELSQLVWRHSWLDSLKNVQMRVAASATGIRITAGTLGKLGIIPRLSQDILR